MVIKNKIYSKFNFVKSHKYFFHLAWSNYPLFPLPPPPPPPKKKKILWEGGDEVIISDGGKKGLKDTYLTSGLILWRLN